MVVSSGERIVLEEISEKDIDGLFKCYSNQNAMSTFGRKPVETKDEALGIIRQNIKMKEENTGIRYAAKLKDTKEFAGFITLKRYNSIDFRTEIDYLVLPEYQGKGIASEMLHLLLKISKSWKLERITAYVDLNNLASCKLLEKANFKNEGILRSWVRDGDSFYDVYSFSFLLSDFKN
ncbi:GNAT family N-acetyltransferase [Oceanobacillus damuensis]|uniref:GNAT family N-acetyltransferase n=1 Tax=Oceanobacillus damuensis TaxID=937928 RepID=UPI0008350EE3|nr:GNAT family protein [Oceanobacillus damuensis]